MADNVSITNGGSPFTASSDEVAVNGGSTGQVAYGKLVDGTNGGTEGIPGSAANGLFVDVKRIVPGTGASNLGKAEDSAHADGDVGVMMLGVRNYSGAGSDGDYAPISVAASGEQRIIAHRELTRIAVTSGGLTTATTAYTSADQVGTIFNFANAARVSGGSGTVVGATLISAADIIGAYDLVLFRQSVTLASDNAAFAISDADALHLIGIVQMYSAYDIGNNRIAQAFNLAIPYDCSGSTSLYGALITRAGHTFFGATTDLLATVWVERN